MTTGKEERISLGQKWRRPGAAARLAIAIAAATSLKGDLLHFVLFTRTHSYLHPMQALPLYLCACRVATKSQALPALRRVSREFAAGVPVSV